MKKKILILAAILVYGLGSFAGEEQPVSMSSAMVAQLTLDVPTLTSDQLAEITAIAQIYENNAEEINTTYSADIYSRAAAKQVAYEEYAANLQLILTAEQRQQYQNALASRRENKLNEK